jgi:hypothetical protein
LLVRGVGLGRLGDYSSLIGKPHARCVFAGQKQPGEKRSLAAKITLAALPQKIACGADKPIRLASGLEGAIAQLFQNLGRN